jgi:hypothetical protein
MVGSDGSLWLQQDNDGVSVEYLTLNSAGERQFSVRLGRHQQLLAASLDMIWVSELDSDDIPTIVRYRVTKK